MPDTCQPILDRIVELKIEKQLLQDDLSIELGGDLSLVFSYSRVEVFSTRIVAAGAFAIARRLSGYSVSTNAPTRRLDRSFTQ